MKAAHAASYVHGELHLCRIQPSSAWLHGYAQSMHAARAAALAHAAGGGSCCKKSAPHLFERVEVDAALVQQVVQGAARAVLGDQAHVGRRVAGADEVDD